MCLSSCFIFKKKTYYDMRISDFSSDLCSSDLLCQPKKKRGCQGSPQILNRKTHSPYRRIRRKPHVQIIVDRLHQLVQFMLEKMVRATDLVMMDGDALQIGRETCRERVCQYG